MKRLSIALLLTACTTIPNSPQDDFGSQLRNQVAAASLCSAQPVTSITARNGAVFTLAAPTQCVLSALGDPICAVPFSVTHVTPDVDTSGGVTRNGRMFNIPIGATSQSFDSRATSGLGASFFTQPVALPKAFNAPGDTMLAATSEPVGFVPSTRTYAYNGQTQFTYVQSYGIISGDTNARICGAQAFGDNTTLMRRPSAGDRSLAYDIRDFIPHILPIPTLPPSGHIRSLDLYKSGSPSLNNVYTSWWWRYFTARDRGNDYGNYTAGLYGDRALVALQNVSFPSRLDILLGLSQDAIDMGGAFLAGAVWQNNGGHNNGVHLPLLKWLGWLTGDSRFKFLGSIAQKRVAEHWHYQPGTNFYEPSFSVMYQGFDVASPWPIAGLSYNSDQLKQMQYMSCCAAANTSSWWVALNILGQVHPELSDTDAHMVTYYRQWRRPMNAQWNADLMVPRGTGEVRSTSLVGWWGSLQPMAQDYWGTFGWQ